MYVLGKRRRIENVEYVNGKRKHGGMCERDVWEEVRRKKVGAREYSKNYGWRKFRGSMDERFGKS